jgi:DNA-binding IclR family transcriptional regulator
MELTDLAIPEPVDAVAAAEPTYRAPAVDRAFQILSLLQTHGEGLGVSEIARKVGIGKGPCFGILKTLETAEAVVCERSRKLYRLGAALVRLGSAASGQHRYLEIARGEMARLAGEIQLTCFLVAPYGEDEVIAVARAEFAGGVTITVELGQHSHRLSAGNGKALLAWRPRAEADMVVRRLGLPRITPRSITDPHAFRRELERTRRNGYAEAHGEFVLGVNSVSAPIFNAAGEVVLLLKAIGAQSYLTPRRMRECGRRVRRAAELVTAELGGRYPRLAEID